MKETKKSEVALAEEQVLARWAKDQTFEKSLDQRKSAEYFSFNDGPPFANGLPHFGHSLVTGIKDSILRYKTMRGYYVPRRNGWDCHGLPVEYDVEKQFGVSGKKQILELGIEKFNAACRESIFRYKDQWEDFLTRYGRWSDYDNYYATVDTNYTESVWWVLAEINKKGFLKRGFQSTPYCPRCETPLSNFELNEGYRDNVPDPSVFALFPLKDEPKVKLLAWTTTPWTLPANAALAVDADADYAYVELKTDGSKLILAKDRLDVLDLRKHDYSILKTVKGRELVGLHYEPLYQLLNPASFNDEQKNQAWQVFADDSVSLEDGTGILHVAPRYGETDLALGLRENLPLIESVDASGHMVDGVEGVGGKFFKDADEHIIAKLTQDGRIFAAEIFSHTYPFCWRCDTPLMYFANTAWFVAVSQIRDQLVKTSQDINWTPANIKKGRFGKWLEGARDWSISRNRYWGAPLPIWVSVDNEDDYIVVGSIAELEELAGKDAVQKAVKRGEEIDLHRPFIDEITFQKDGKTYRRVEQVLDCWFESGSMPVAQLHYPFENKEAFDKTFPADFITEGLDQTRLWFYVQHVISTILFDRPAYKNVVVNGIIMAADGQKLSKRLRNYPPTEEVFDVEGADAWRLYLLSSTQATETAAYMRFNRDAMRDMQRNVLGTLTNSFKFFKTYAEIDKWAPEGKLAEPSSDNILDQWMIARVNQAITASTKNADDYRIAHAITPVFELIDDLSNWYIRRSRRRFWKSQNDTDKLAAYATLHYSLARVCQLLAPWAPFISDKLWQELSEGNDLPESVHLSDWPSVKEPDTASQKLLDDMATLCKLITGGLEIRAREGIKVRQPLAGAILEYSSPLERDLLAIAQEELNVKKIDFNLSGEEGSSSIRLATEVTPDLKAEGIARELVRSIQNARKNAGFDVQDRIKLEIETSDPEITEAKIKFQDIIFAETLTSGGLEGTDAEHQETIKLNGQEVGLKLRKA